MFCFFKAKHRKIKSEVFTFSCRTGTDAFVTDQKPQQSVGFHAWPLEGSSDFSWFVAEA